ncbi:prolyl oligopeptidase family serine peptidase [Nocardia sp. ET3-3]|uniref:Prolyl oligopeptidase family serine peptidase n=1 Tax=Nocardia terrae TaxID=2675851 RepID=A0A7K1VBI1_9NOCA|nr:CocE/NonD family hydrolase [Nocardia terrae]MVU83448.1 prolyl oligopeptidase family serine peptidase [Nocardia terrae]
MSQANSGQLRLITPDQEAAVLALVQDLLTGDATGVSTYLTSDVDAVRSRCGIRNVKIPGHEGVQLDALIAWPRTDGPHPLIVMPAGLDPTGWKMYGGAVIRLLMRGYAVVAYTERGLPGSGGELTVAGPEDVQDGHAVIAWALQHSELEADENRIGMMGISYGSGISQLVAHQNDKVKAVVALSTWADLGEALYDNGTRHIAAARALGNISENPSAELTKMLEYFEANTNIGEVLDYAKPRSPAHAERTVPEPVPTFFTSFWHETIFPQNQLLAYFERYPGPKRLDLAIGDHSSVEVAGLLTGVYTRTTEAAYDWLDRYVLGMANGIDQDGAVHTETMHGFDMTSSPDLATWSKSTRRYYLHAPATGSPDGRLTVEQPASQSQSFQAGSEQVMAAKTLVFDGMFERLLMPNRQPFKDIDRTKAAVWSTPHIFLKPHHIAGTPELSVTVTPSGKTATLITYLFDLDPFNRLRIITHAAATITNDQAAQPKSLRVRLQATDYQLPALHRLIMVIDTVDHLYLGDENPPTGIVTLSSETGPSYIDIPIAP